MNIERNLNLDLLRIISAIAVVAIHVTTKYFADISLLHSDVWNFSNIINNSSRFAVPMFFMISGYFLLNNKANQSYMIFYKRKLPKVLIPFIFWSVFYLIFYLITIGNFNLYAFLKQTVFTAIGIPTYYHLWFFYQLIGLYLVTPLIIKFIDKLNSKDVAFIVCIFVFQNTFIEMFIKTTSSQSFIEIPFSGYSFFYYILGGLFGRGGLGILTKFKKWIFTLAIVSLFININGTKVIIGEIGEFSDLFIKESIITVMIYCIGVFLIVSNLKLNLLSNKVRKLIVKISGLTMGIYLIHPFVLDFFIEPIHMGNIGIYSVLFELSLTSIISILFTLVIQKIPLLKNIIP